MFHFFTVFLCFFKNPLILRSFEGKSTDFFKRSFKAIPHKDCRGDAHSAFRQIVQNDAEIPAYFKGGWAKMTSVCEAKCAARSLCGVALILIFGQSIDK
jgi:hypothetical protein